MRLDTPRTDTERRLYERAWQVEQYRHWSPADDAVGRFLAVSGAKPLNTLCDFGCGTGRAGLALSRDHGFLVSFVDITDALLDPKARPFHCRALWEKHAKAHYGFCVDVLEHIPTELVGLSIVRMLESVRSLYIEVCTSADNLGMLVGEPLHKTVRDFVWWRDLAREVAVVHDARHLLNKTVLLLGEK